MTNCLGLLTCDRGCSSFLLATLQQRLQNAETGKLQWIHLDNVQSGKMASRYTSTCQGDAQNTERKKNRGIGIRNFGHHLSSVFLACELIAVFSQFPGMCTLYSIDQGGGVWETMWPEALRKNPRPFSVYWSNIGRDTPRPLHSGNGMPGKDTGCRHQSSSAENKLQDNPIFVCEHLWFILLLVLLCVADFPTLASITKDLLEGTSNNKRVLPGTIAVCFCQSCTISQACFPRHDWGCGWGGKSACTDMPQITVYHMKLKTIQHPAPSQVSHNSVLHPVGGTGPKRASRKKALFVY